MIEMGFKMMWQNVLLEKDPYKCNQMIKDIILLQPYLSSYYEATKDIIVKQPEYQKFLMDNNQQLQQQQHEEKNQIKEEGFTRLDNYNKSFTFTYDEDDDEDDNRKF